MTPARRRNRTPVGHLLALLALLAAALPAAGVGAVGEPFRLDDGTTCRESGVDLARLADGGVVAVWLQGVEPDVEIMAPLRVFARRFEADGSPRGASFLVESDDPAAFLEPVRSPVVAAHPDGGFLVAWVSRGADLRAEVLVRVFDGDGTPRAPAAEVDDTHWSGSVDAAPDGDGYRLVWVTPGQDLVKTAFVDASGLPSPTLPLFSLDAPGIYQVWVDAPRIASDAHGFSTISTVAGFAGATLPERPGTLLLGRRVEEGDFDALPTHLEPTTDFYSSAPAIGVDGAGNTVIVWRQEDAEGVRGLRVARLARDGSRRHPVRWLTGPGGWTSLSDPALSVAADGTFRVAWTGVRRGGDRDGLYVAAFDTTGSPTTAERLLRETLLEPGSIDSRDLRDPDLLELPDGGALVAWHEVGSGLDVIPEYPLCNSTGIRALRLDGTGPDLLLHDGRFAVRVGWRDPYSAVERTGTGVAEPLNDRSGWFWFFRPGNAELVVKVLDGRPVNGHFWVFWGGMTSLSYELQVIDRVSGAAWATSSPGRTVGSGADTLALPGVAETAAVTPLSRPRIPPLPAPAPVEAHHTPCDDAIPAGIFPPPGFCLHDRFAVTLDRSDAASESHNAPGRALPAADSGYFWFFHRDNAEVFVKILDGRPVDGHWWLFAGSLTSLPYTLTVEDTVGGTVRTYTSNRGEFRSFVDTRSFP